MVTGAVVFYFVLAGLILGFTVAGLVSVTRAANKHEKSDGPGAKANLGRIAQFQQSLVEINKVPHPRGKGTPWVPSE